jgi:hypothetical protein
MIKVESIEQLTCGACIWKQGDVDKKNIRCANQRAECTQGADLFIYRKTDNFCNQGQWIVYDNFHKRPLVYHRAEAIEHLLLPDDCWKSDNLDNIQDIQDALKDIREQIDQQKNKLNNVDICNIPMR